MIREERNVLFLSDPAPHFQVIIQTTIFRLLDIHYVGIYVYVHLQACIIIYVYMYAYRYFNYTRLFKHVYDV